MVSMAYLKPLGALLKLVRVPPFTYLNSPRGFRFAVDRYGFSGITQLPRGSSQVSKGPPFQKKMFETSAIPVRFKKTSIKKKEKKSNKVTNKVTN